MQHQANERRERGASSPWLGQALILGVAIWALLIGLLLRACGAI